MAKKIDRLSVRGVQTRSKPGHYPDGAGLYLQVSESKTKSWVFRYTLAGRAREMGLGSAGVFSLAEARAMREQQRKRLAGGVDPIEARRADRAHAAVEAAQSKTFEECAKAYIEAHRPGWKNAKHAAQWVNTLATYAYPRIGALPVSAVATGQVQGILQAIWEEKRETASRLRGRLEKILDWATVLGYRVGLNPARWKGHLEKLLARDKRRERIQHHPAVPVAVAGAFMEQLRKQEGMAAKALEFLILAAARTGEVIDMKWSEVDLDSAVWTVPMGRMKGGREHRVPLSKPAVRLLRALPKDEGFVFHGRGAGRALSNMAMLKLLARMGHGAYTIHGFRSTFRDWAAEHTNYSREVCEMALAHAVADETEAAYRRGDLFDKRRRLMLEWSKYLQQPAAAGKVTPINRAA